MKVRPATEVKAKLSEVLDDCRTEPVLITRKGKPDALLVHVDEDTDLETIVRANSPIFRAMILRSDEEIRRGKVISYEDLRAEFLPEETMRTSKRTLAKPRKKPQRKARSS